MRCPRAVGVRRQRLVNGRWGARWSGKLSGEVLVESGCFFTSCENLATGIAKLRSASFDLRCKRSDDLVEHPLVMLLRRSFRSLELLKYILFFGCAAAFFVFLVELGVLFHVRHRPMRALSVMSVALRR